MSRHLRLLWTLLLWVPLGACGGGSDGGGTPPTPTVTAVTISGPDGPYLVGGSYNFTATVTLSNGQTQLASGSWGSDAPTVGTVNNGVFAGVGVGEVTIWIDTSQGVRGTKRLRVHASYNGTWVGSYRITSCTDSGQIRSEVKFCREIFKVGLLAPLGLFMSQNGLSVATTVYLGDIEMNQATSSVTDDGRLQVDATFTENGVTITATLRLHQPQTTSIGGTIAEDWRGGGLSGSAQVAGDLVDVVRQAGAATPLPVMAPPMLSLDDLLRAATREPGR